MVSLFYHPTNEMKDAWDESHREYVKMHQWIEDMLCVE